MTVASNQSRKTFAGNGVTTSFATTPIVFFDSADLIVTVTDDATGDVTTLVENTDYSVTGGGTAPAVGTVSLAGGSSPYGAPASGTTVVIFRDVALTQESDFVNNDGSDAEVAEAALDRLTMISQRLDDRLDRAVHLPDGDATGESMELPALEDRASSVLGFDADGGLTTYDSSSSVTTSDNVTFVPSGTGATATDVQTQLRKNWVVADNYAGASVTAKIDAAIAAAAGRVVIIPPDIGAGEPTSVGVNQPVWDLRNTGIVGAGQKLGFNFTDANGHIRFVVFDDQASPTLSNAACLFMHRPSGALPANQTGEGAHILGQSIGALTSVGSGYILSGVEATANVASTGQTIVNAWGLTANSQTTATSTTNVTNLVSAYAQAPAKNGSGTITNAYSIVAEDPGSAGSSRNWAIWSQGTVQVGIGGSGAVTATLNLNGSDAFGSGVVVGFYRNSTSVAQIGTESAILGGGAGSDLLINKVTSGQVNVGINSTVVGAFTSTGLILVGATAIPAGGTAATGLRFSSTANFGVFFGSSAPTLSAAKGSLYLRSDGTGTTDRAYINTNGSTTWTALTTAA